MDDATGRVKGPGTRKRGTSAAADVKPVDPSLPQETDERARELRDEIAETRGEMSETIEAIQDRLKPSNVVANAKESVRNATTEKVKQMANTAEYAADRVMNNSFMDTVRDNPVPAAMIGIGAAWLLMKGRTESRRYGNGGYYDNQDDRTYGGRYDWRTRTGGADVRGYGAEGVLGETNIDTEAGGGVGERVSEKVSDVASRASDYVNDARYRARRTTRRAQNSFDRVMRENPLALGAAATLIGAAIGMTLPATEAENELMGDARDTVVERARGVASDAAERVQNAAEQVKDVASKTANATRPDSSGSRPNSGGSRPDTSSTRPGGSI
jgi:ElaB/YqjD/DUF883 family membrane-anchored ribosome-binding protein